MIPMFNNIQWIIIVECLKYKLNYDFYYSDWISNAVRWKLVDKFEPV